MKRRAKHRPRLSLVVMREDGSRVMTARVSRGLLVGAAGLVPLALVALGLVVGEELQFRAATRDAASLREQLAVQRASLERSERIAAEIRSEIAGWKPLHARLRAPFGPEAAPRTTSGIGGAAQMIERRYAAASAQGGLAELERTQAAVREEGEKLRALDRLMAHAGKMLAALPSRWPARGPVNSEFGVRSSPWALGQEFHSGIDIAVASGTPVHAPSAGIVVQAGPNGDNGLAVVVDHGQEVKTLYGHLARVSVRVGQSVERGTVLGSSGNTGRSTGPHLHYEIQIAGRAVDPRTFLWQ